MKKTLQPFYSDPSLSDLLRVPWRQHQVGGASLDLTGTTLRIVNVDTTSDHVSNAQIDDYAGLPRRRFPRRPPLRLTIRARFSHPDGELVGTAGFGFWNDPFLMTGLRWPALPRAIWFFYASPSSNLKLDIDVPGAGWKAAVIDAIRPAFFLLAPWAPLAVPLMNVPALYRACWPLGQRAIGVREALLDLDITAWHTYVIEWEERTSSFFIDGQTVLSDAPSPRSPLGFVIWLDNQYMQITPLGRFCYGWLDAPGEQWLELSELRFE